MWEVVRIGSIIIFHLSKLRKVKFSIRYDVIFPMRLQKLIWNWSFLGVKGLKYKLWASAWPHVQKSAASSQRYSAQCWPGGPAPGGQLHVPGERQGHGRVHVVLLRQQEVPTGLPGQTQVLRSQVLLRTAVQDYQGHRFQWRQDFAHGAEWYQQKR